MLKNKAALRSVLVSTALVAVSLGAIAQIVEPPRPAQLAAGASVVTTAVTPKAAIVKDIDLAARAPFQASVLVDFNNFVYTPVPIPAGQRLVIEYVSISGAAQSNNGPVQPIVLLATSLADNPSAAFYLAPTPATALPTQFYHAQPTTLYADSLQIGPGYAGYTPSYLILNVVVSGHLIAIP